MKVRILPLPRFKYHYDRRVKVFAVVQIRKVGKRSKFFNQSKRKYDFIF